MLPKRRCATFFQKTIIIYFTLIYTNLCPTCFGDFTDNKLTAEDLLKSVLTAEKTRPSISARINIISKLSQSNQVETHRYISEYRRDKSRIDVTCETHYYNKEQATSKLRSIWDGSKYINRAKKESYDPLYAISLNKKYGHNISIKTWSAPWLNGIVQGDYKSAIQVIKDSDLVTLSSQKEQINGSQCYLVESKTSRGNYKIWVDAENGFSIRKIVVRKTDNDLNMDKPTGKKIIEIEINNKNIEKFEKSYIVKESTMRAKAIVNGKIIYDDFYHAKLSNIELNPDFEKMGAFLMDEIPNGAKITHFDFPGIRYIWQDKNAIIDIKLNDIFNNIDAELKNNKNTSQNIIDNQVTLSPILCKEESNKNTKTKYNDKMLLNKNKSIHYYLWVTGIITVSIVLIILFQKFL